MMSLSLLASLSIVAGPAASGGELATCSASDLAAPVVDPAELAAHRAGPLPAIAYAAGQAPPHWGFVAHLLVDADGRVRCHALSDRWDAPAPLTAERRDWLAGLAAVRYRPFRVEGEPRTVRVDEDVREYERPPERRALPEVALDAVELRLERGPCFGACPVYTVTIHGDGRVRYEGKRFVDVAGVHHYTIPRERVQALVEQARAGDLWSMRSEYAAAVTDHPRYRLALRFGEARHEIVDYVGAEAGMPPAVDAFEQAIDAAAGTAGWVRLDETALDRLDAAGFDFRSATAGEMLARAAAHAVDAAGGDADRALVRLLGLGAPLDRGDGDLLLQALDAGRGDFAIALLDAGALPLDADGAAARLDAAFQAAIRGGRLAAVEKLWSLDQPRHAPSLSFTDLDADGRGQQLPVSLLLRAPVDDPGWQGREIAQWLGERGCDPHARAADGHTLLHVAAEANQPAFVRDLLAQGLDPSTPGAYGLPALAATRDEEVALLLLDAGTDLAALDQGPQRFRDYARDRQWSRVLAWLAAHPR